MTIDSSVMLKRLTTAFIAMCLILPTTPAFAYSILWAATSYHTDLVKDEEYIAAPAVLFMGPGVDEDVSLLIEETDGGLKILYEEPVPTEPDSVEEELVPPEPIIVERESALPELISVEDEVQLDFISVEEEPEALEEIELEEIINDEIQIP